MFRIASLLLATMATATAATTSSKAYRIFSIPAHPKAGKASNSAFIVSEGSFISTKSAKALDLSSSLSLSSKTAKTKDAKSAKVKEAKSAKVWCDPSASLSMSTILDGGNSTFSDSLSMRSKAAKSKMAKCHPMSASMSITTAMPTYYPTYMPTDEPTNVPTHAPTHVPTTSPTGQPTTRRPTQRMVCQSGDFVDGLGRDCFWYEDPNVELGCESLRDEIANVTNSEGQTPWEECCFCGGGTMVPENTTNFFDERRLDVLTESQDVDQEEVDVVSASTAIKGQSVVCVSNRDFVDPLGRDCSFYIPENIEQGCDSLHGEGDLINEFPWMNAEGLTPWSECCFCGGGALEYGAALGEEAAAY